MTFPTNHGLSPTQKPTQANAIRNEQLKLIATYLNGIAIALVTVGILAPTFALIYGAQPTRVDGWAFAGGYLICALGSLTLHLTAVGIIRGMRP